MDSQKKEMVVQDRVAGLYEGVRYRKAHSRQYNEWRMEQLASFLDPATLAPLSILDDGCGVGHLCNWVNDKMRGNALCFGSDLSSEMLKHASKYSFANLCQANSEELPYKDKTFDVVFANSILHHLLSPSRGISEIQRVLKPGGVVCLVDPNRSLIPSIIRSMFQKKDHFSEVHKDFSARELVNMLKVYFEVESFRYFGYVAYPLLGFPDVIDLFELLHLPRWSVRLLIRLDEVISRIPLVRSQSFGIMIYARKGDA